MALNDMEFIKDLERPCYIIVSVPRDNGGRMSLVDYTDVTLDGTPEENADMLDEIGLDADALDMPDDLTHATMVMFDDDDDPMPILEFSEAVRVLQVAQETFNGTDEVKSAFPEGTEFPFSIFQLKAAVKVSEVSEVDILMAEIEQKGGFNHGSH